jgi:SAM-dependent methyltransferase
MCPTTPEPSAELEAARTNGDPGNCPVCADRPRRQHGVVRAGQVAVCAACGTWYRVPRPSPDKLAKIYDRHYYDSWGAADDEEIALATKRATFRPILDRIAQTVGNPTEPVRILDVGAATGTLLTLARERGWEPYALELNPHAADVLRNLLGPERVFEGELKRCGFPPGSFHALTMTDLIEHVLDVAGTLTQAAALLRPGGVLCVTTPRIDSLSRVLLGRTWLHFKEEHIQYFSRASLAGALRQAGFVQVEISNHPKRLVFDYLYRQLKTYPHGLLTPVATAVRGCLPRALRRRPLPLQCGEMVAFARRKPETEQ